MKTFCKIDKILGFLICETLNDKTCSTFHEILLEFSCGYVDRVQDAKEGGLDALVWFAQELGPSVVSDKLEEPPELQTLSLMLSKYCKFVLHF